MKHNHDNRSDLDAAREAAYEAAYEETFDAEYEKAFEAEYARALGRVIPEEDARAARV